MIFVFSKIYPPQIKEIQKLEEAKLFAIMHLESWRYLGAKMDHNSEILAWDSDPVQEAIRCHTSSDAKIKKQESQTPKAQ